MKELQKLTEEERNYLKEYGSFMLESKIEEGREIAGKLFINEYLFLKEKDKDVSEFDYSFKLYHKNHNRKL